MRLQNCVGARAPVTTINTLNELYWHNSYIYCLFEMLKVSAFYVDVLAKPPSLTLAHTAAKTACFCRMYGICVVKLGVSSDFCGVLYNTSKNGTILTNKDSTSHLISMPDRWRWLSNSFQMYILSSVKDFIWVFNALFSAAFNEVWKPGRVTKHHTCQGICLRKTCQVRFA
jgi:hypothetical protein